jgi:hypothetical protein
MEPAEQYKQNITDRLYKHLLHITSQLIDEVEEDTRKLGYRNWLAAAQDRGHWRHMLEEAKACPGL